MYGEGEEPDPRFSFANQRTLLAWARTALAFVLAAAVLDAVPVRMTSEVRLVVALVLSVLGVFAAVHGWRSWAAAERAMRLGQSLPSSARSGVVVVVGVVVCAVLVALVVLTGP